MKVVNGQERNWTQVLIQSYAFHIEPCCHFSSVKQQTENSDQKKKKTPQGNRKCLGIIYGWPHAMDSQIITEEGGLRYNKAICQ